MGAGRPLVTTPSGLPHSTVAGVVLKTVFQRGGPGGGHPAIISGGVLHPETLLSLVPGALVVPGGGGFLASVRTHRDRLQPRTPGHPCGRGLRRHTHGLFRGLRLDRRGGPGGLAPKPRQDPPGGSNEITSWEGHGKPDGAPSQRSATEDTGESGPPHLDSRAAEDTGESGPPHRSCRPRSPPPERRVSCQGR